VSVPLTAYFRSRGVAQREVTPGLFVPEGFSDPVSEHQATRTRAALFDFSFMSQFEISGPQAVAYLHTLQVREIAPVARGRILYTVLCREDGTVLNDATVWVHGDGRYWLFTGRRADRDHIQALAERFEVAVEDRSGELSVIALQGPASRLLLERVDRRLAQELRYFRFARSAIDDTDVWIGRIGYTGERGYELLIHRAAAVALWERLRGLGESLGVAECGFETANCLRIEAGYILFARELHFRVTPAALGYGRLVVSPNATALRTPPALLVGLRPASGRPGRAPAPLPGLPDSVLPPVEKGRACLTSACWSPLYGADLGMGYVCQDDRHPGSRVMLQDGRAARVARLPYYDPPRAVPRR